MRTTRGDKMFKRPKQQVTYTIMDGNKVVKQDTFDSTGPVSFTVQIETAPVVFPDRSPLHAEALNFDDLKVGLVVQRRSVRSNDSSEIGVITHDPFKYGTKAHGSTNDYFNNQWQVTVATTQSWDNKLVLEDWYLSDMGIVPYGETEDPNRHWNEQNYTLAVK